jgi:hypothetical protein
MDSPALGCRTRVVCVPVDQGRSWQEAITAVDSRVGPHWDIRKVGDLYPGQSTGPEDEDIVLVNFGRTMSDLDVIGWGMQFKFVPKPPRSVFAVAEHKHRLLWEPEDNLSIISLVPCMFEGGRYVCHVWFHDKRSDPNLLRYNEIRDGRFWFAFGEHL